MAIDDRKLEQARKPGFGLGLLKGLGVTLKHLFKHNTVIQYPDVKRELPARTRGVIALKEENCTVCMLCSRECPDWCIYIDSHKETLPPKREGGRPRKRNVLDRFAIDYSLCMYCGICVEVCPYDALFWSPEFEYSEYDIRELTHEKERLSDWMAFVKPPPPLDEGAEQPGMPIRETPAATAAPAPGAVAGPPKGATIAAASPTIDRPAEADVDRLPPAPQPTSVPEGQGAAGPGSAQRPAPPSAETAAEERPEQSDRVTAPAAAPAPSAEQATESQQQAGETRDPQPGDLSAPTEAKTEAGSKEAPAEAAAPPAEEPRVTEDQAPPVAPPAQDSTTLTDDERAQYQEAPGPNVDVPHEEPRPVALEPTEDAEAVYQAVLKEQQEKGSSPQVAEARARVARAKAERGIRRGPTPIEVEKPVPSAPPKGHVEPTPSGAPRDETPQPDPGPVAPTASEDAGATAADPSSPPLDGESGVDAAPVAPAKEEPRTLETAAPSEGSRVTPPPGGESPDDVYERVYAEEKGKGSSDTVAVARAKAARVRAQRAKG